MELAERFVRNVRRGDLVGASGGVFGFVIEKVVFGNDLRNEMCIRDRSGAECGFREPAAAVLSDCGMCRSLSLGRQEGVPAWYFFLSLSHKE